MTHPTRRFVALVGILVGILAVPCLVDPCRAALQPDEIAIIAVRGNRDSEALAEHYAKVRGIPEEHIRRLLMPKGETLSRQEWTWAIRPEIQKWILEHDPDKKIRCLVTTWGVPLRIGRAPSGDTLQRYQQFLQGARAGRLEILKKVLQSLEQLGPGAGLSGSTSADDSKIAPKPSAKPSASDEKEKTELEQIETRLDIALKQAQAQLATLSQKDEKQQGFKQLQQLATAVGGMNILLQGLNQRLAGEADEDPAVRSDFERLRGRTIAYVETKSILERMAPDIQRDALMLTMLERSGGLLASLKWLDEQLAVVKKNQTGASFDSELSLLMWPDDYQLLRWQPNYLRHDYDNSQLPKVYRTLMVARLDAPTFALAKGLVDTAIAVEAEGLQGKVYLDSRGIGKLDQKNVSAGSYADYDRALLITAQGIESMAVGKQASAGAGRTGLEVVLETSPKLFQPGECPKAALYCGWYSLANYIDAFNWVPGAVAYHLASSEATTLHNPESQVWCKRMLEEGVCATLGPVNEPYLMAFPRPNEFFALLLQGDLTLVECYYRTKPFNSWMMTLIGDPLYRPFAKKVTLHSSARER